MHRYVNSIAEKCANVFYEKSPAGDCRSQNASGENDNVTKAEIILMSNSANPSMLIPLLPSLIPLYLQKCL